jgi:hypothetical protein
MSRRKPRRYITLISVPHRHPVFVAVDWSVYAWIPPKERPFVQLCEVEQSILATLKPLTLRLPESAYYIGQNHTLLDSVEAGESLASYPEMVLGADLPCECIKWTKDIRLLTRGDRRKKLREKWLSKETD